MPLRLRPDIATTDTDDGVVLLDERTGRYWQLNPTGAQVLRALLEGHQPDHIARELATRYGIDPPQAEHDVTTITDHLLATKLVVAS